MSESVTNDLLLEHLKRIQARLVTLSRDMSEIKDDNRAHRSLTSALVQNDEMRGSQIAHLQLRLDRIERRLDLTEGV